MERKMLTTKRVCGDEEYTIHNGSIEFTDRGKNEVNASIYLTANVKQLDANNYVNEFLELTEDSWHAVIDKISIIRIENDKAAVQLEAVMTIDKWEVARVYNEVIRLLRTHQVL